MLRHQGISRPAPPHLALASPRAPGRPPLPAAGGPPGGTRRVNSNPSLPALRPARRLQEFRDRSLSSRCPEPPGASLGAHLLVKSSKMLGHPRRDADPGVLPRMTRLGLLRDLPNRAARGVYFTRCRGVSRRCRRRLLGPGGIATRPQQLLDVHAVRLAAGAWPARRAPARKCRLRTAQVEVLVVQRELPSVFRIARGMDCPRHLGARCPRGSSDSRAAMCASFRSGQWMRTRAERLRTGACVRRVLHRRHLVRRDSAAMRRSVRSRITFTNPSTCRPRARPSGARHQISQAIRAQVPTVVLRIAVPPPRAVRGSRPFSRSRARRCDTPPAAHLSSGIRRSLSRRATHASCLRVEHTTGSRARRKAARRSSLRSFHCGHCVIPARPCRPRRSASR